jgi:hypothetical protein
MTRCESESDSRPRPCASVSRSQSLARAPRDMTRPCSSLRRRGHPGAAHLAHWRWRWHLPVPVAFRRRGPASGTSGSALAGPSLSWPLAVAGRAVWPKSKGPLRVMPGPLRVPFRPRDLWLQPLCLPVPAISIMILQKSRTLACDDHDRTVTKTVRANRTRRLRAGHGARL